MNQKTKTIIKSLSFFIVFAMSVITIQTFAAFTPPTGNPLNNNVAAPINSGEALQRKEGGLIVEFFRVMGLTLVGGNLEVAGAVKIYGGNPGVGKVLVSDATGLASWVDPNTLGIGGGGITGVVPVTQGGTGLSTIPAHSIWVANSKDVVTTLTPAAGNSIRLNSAGTAWESFTPLTSNGTGGTVNTISKFTGPHTLGDSNLTDDGTMITAGGNFKIANKLYFSTIVLTLNSSNVTNLELNNATYFQIGTLPGDPTSVIQGFAPPSGQQHSHGRVVYITNQEASKSFTIKNNSTSTAPANRIQVSDNADLTLGPRETIMLFYDTGFPGASRWRVLLGPN